MRNFDRTNLNKIFFSAMEVISTDEDVKAKGKLLFLC